MPHIMPPLFQDAREGKLRSSFLLPAESQLPATSDEVMPLGHLHEAAVADGQTAEGGGGGGGDGGEGGGQRLPL